MSQEFESPKKEIKLLPPENARNETKLSEHNEREPSQSDQHCQPSTDVAALIVAQSREACTDRQERRRENRGNIFRQWITIVLLFFAFGATVVQAWIFHNQLHEMQMVYGPIEKQAKAAVDQIDSLKRQLTLMEADQRPWISTDIETASDLTFDDSGGTVLFRYKLKNVGRSPALNVNVSPKFIPNKQLLTFTLPPDATSELRAQCAEIEKDTKELLSGDLFIAWGSVLYPGDPVTIEALVGINIPKKNNSAITSVDFSGQILFVSCIDYQSSVDRMHHQVGEVYWLTENGRDIDGSDRKTVPRKDIGFRPAQIWGSKYAN